MVKDIKKKVGSKNGKKVDHSLAIIALLLNILLLPGIGSIIGGRIKEGIFQLVLLIGGFFIGFLLMFMSFVAPLLSILGFIFVFLGPLSAWIWGLVTGISLISEADAK